MFGMDTSGNQGNPGPGWEDISPEPKKEEPK